MIIPGVSHEHISLLVMRRINAEMNGALNDAVRIFDDRNPRHFLHELISSQLDMDRLDYLCRDSFFTGVREGNVGAARIIQMLNVKEDHIVVEEKGIYSIENYLMTRRMMYWQVYFHKTAVAAELVLTGALRRARQLIHQGKHLFASPALDFFLRNDFTLETFDNNPVCLDNYLELDDNDIISALKVWLKCDDFILSTLSSHFINRQVFKTDIYDGLAPANRLNEVRMLIAAKFGLKPEDTDFFASEKVIEKDMYNKHADQIRILLRNGDVSTMPEVSEIIRNDAAATPYRKTYLIHERL